MDSSATTYMPISDYHGMPAILDEVYRLQPQRTLDLGVGFGLYGAAMRQVLDAMYGRCRTDQWQREIYGVEGFEDYRNPVWDAYNSVAIGDFAQSSDLRGFDLVLMVDSLEHLEPETGREFLKQIVDGNKHVILSVPVQYMPQDAAHGNEFERHRTHHSGTEFDCYRPVVLWRGACLAASIKGRA